MSGIPTIFLSHSSDDKPFVKRLAKNLDGHGIRVWIDEAELKVGDSLIDKIREGIDDFEYLLAVISPISIESEWVKREIDVAMNQEISGKKVKVLPVKLGDVELPGFLLGKLYADFTSDESYAKGLKKLVESVGVVFNRHVLDSTRTTSTLGNATDRSDLAGVPMMVSPFHRPAQYLGQSAKELGLKLGAVSNKVGNLIIENDSCKLFLETEGDFINFGDAEIKALPPWQLSKSFDSEIILGAFSVNPSELELVQKKTDCHTYYDHSRKLKLTVACRADGERLLFTFGKKYYGL